MHQQNARDGKAIEEVGTYDPMVADKSKRVVLKMDRIDHWVSVGAQPSDKVAVLIKKVKTGNFGTAKAPAPMLAPKERPKPAPAEEAPAAEAPATEGEAAEAPAES
ncbi:30S ribosomal protein S16 [Caulifigura coniformis]|uniref:30S ribosomal protein S16 n=2 Tax=Caulifigura coniformis TaxID=2527983 RepID=A0A517S8F8_9PLAN|nr:30S ribosomal protein S16 [Caulifigura coniformis]